MSAIEQRFIDEATRLVDTETARLRKVKIDNLARELQRQAATARNVLPTGPEAEKRISELEQQRSRTEQQRDEAKAKRDFYRVTDCHNVLVGINQELRTLQKARAAAPGRAA